MTKAPRRSAHIDQARIRKREEAKETLRLAFECGDEDRFVELLKEVNPGIKPEKLVSLVEEFRKIRRIRTRGV
jgi:hypothetical protein